MPRPPLRYRIASWFTRLSERTSDAWYRFTSPFERFFARIGEGAFGALDSFQGVESFVIGVVRTLFWPFILLGRLVSRYIPVSEGGPGPVARFLWYPIGLAQRLIDRLNLDWLVLLLVRLLTPIWWPIVQLLGFTKAWIATREPRELALAAPAVVLAIPFLFVGVRGALLSQSQVAERYKVAVRDAVEAGDYARVDLFERKLAQMGVDTRRADYRTAIKLDDAGNTAGAYARMVRLASPDRPGYPSAHAWLVQRLIAGKIGSEIEPAIEDSEKANLRLAERHLDRLEELKISGVELTRMRALIYAETDRVDQAVDLLQAYSDTSLSCSTMRMQILAKANRLAEAKRQAEVVLGLIRDPQIRSRMTPVDYPFWSFAASLAESPSELRSALKAWIEVDPENEQPGRLLRAYRQKEAARMLANPTSSPTAAAKAFIEAVEMGDATEWALVQARRLAAARSRDRYARQVWSTLEKNASLPIELLAAMATTVAGEGDIEMARSMFAKLIEQTKGDAVAHNNYAWTLSQEPNPDLPQAMEQVELALEIRPGDYRFRETRGQVLLAMKKWEAAIEDLEYALNGIPESSEIHSGLATAYEALSKPTLASIHRRQAAD